MLSRDILFFCFASTLPLGCALDRIDADLRIDGDASVGGGGGGNQTSAPGASLLGGQSSAGGARSTGGNATAASSALLGGGTSVGGLASTAASSTSTSVVGGATSVGSNGSTGGSPQSGGAANVGGTSPAGSNVAVGGTYAMGGASVSIGGTSAVAGGSGAMGGTSASIGSTIEATGGATVAIGGATAAIGGATAAIGGATAAIGGATAAIGGVSPTGGSATTGGVSGAGGTTGALVPTSITTGWYHGCAIMSDATVRCWGSEYCGALGNGSDSSSSGLTCNPNAQSYANRLTFTIQNKPVVAKGISNAVAISAGKWGLHTCVVHGSGHVSCWGWNEFGQLGDGTVSIDSVDPVAVRSIASAKSVAASTASTCALLADSTVQCWGLNFEGQLGNGTTDNSSVPTPVLVRNTGGVTSSLQGAVDISAGYRHACALLNDRSVWCWGNNGSGQLGNGTTDTSLYAVKVPFANAAEVSAGNEHSCARDLNGGVWCLGYNSDGQLGDGTTTQRPSPVSVKTITSGSTAVAVAGTFSCAVLDVLSGAQGIVRCWGDNDFGKLGNGNTTQSSTPVDVLDLTNISQLSVDANHTCALSSGSVYCWGEGELGQLGNGRTNDAWAPVQVTDL